MCTRRVEIWCKTLQNHNQVYLKPGFSPKNLMFYKARELREPARRNQFQYHCCCGIFCREPLAHQFLVCLGVYALGGRAEGGSSYFSFLFISKLKYPEKVFCSKKASHLNNWTQMKTQSIQQDRTPFVKLINTS